MQIVIDIPEEIYNHTQEYEVGGFSQENDAKLFIAIKNGTPLPKGHGDLIDRNELIENGINKVFCDWYDEIKYADAIIEADGGDAE